MSAPNRQNAGFTLVEVLVALIAAVLVLGVVLAGLRLSTRLRQAGEQATARNAEFQTSARLLRRLIARTAPVVFGDEDSARYVFSGTPTSLRFVTLMPGYPGQPGPHLFVLEQAGGGEASYLRLRRTPLPRDENPLESVDFEEDLVLVKGPLRLAFSYFRGPRDGKPGKWLDQWDAPTDFPRLIRLHLEKTGPQRRVWPDIIVRLAIDMDGACVLARKSPGRICRLDQEPAP